MIRASEFPAAVWRKSSRSQNGANNCVEVAYLGNTMAVRDSKNPDGPALVFRQGAFAAFLNTVKAGRFDR